MTAREPIAIVGMGCRFPGGANNPGAFWQLLCEGVDAIGEVPPNRWNADRFHHINPAAPGRMVTRWGGFVENVDAFDAAFFGIAPREAARIDPQHRWLAEVTWEAIEDAGLPPEQLSGSRTGVFIGIATNDYPMLHRQQALSIDGYVNIGGALSIAANRLSFLFNFRGPSLAVDTACSSSLVALHLAARSLWSGECDYTLVGGANALLTPEPSVGFSQARMLSPRGRCRAFDAGADGYVRAEGAAALLLMPLRRAESLGLHPRAVLLATASNQDGHSSSLTVPNQQAQEELIREALQSAAVAPRDVAYVEAHGTGTTVGDRVEVRAIAAVLAQERTPDEPLLLGSVKTNIGHLESASGIAGLVKGVLVLEKQTAPRNLHFETPNPRLPLERIKVPAVLTPLQSCNGHAGLVGVNSFGFGGTNAHALLGPSSNGSAAEEVGEPGWCIFPVSARSPFALADYGDAYAKFISENAGVSLRELCAAAALGKSHHPFRTAVVVDSLDGLRTQSRGLRKSAAELKPASTRPKIAFVFSGQGSQWWAMGRQLYRSEKIVRDFWHRCDEVCRKLGGPNLLEALLAAEADSPLARTDLAQPALFALQGSLVELWGSWGIKPDMVVGHSVGEAAAAWSAGIYDLETVLRVVIVRSRWQAKMRGLGRMLAAGISAEEALVWEQHFRGRVSLAAINAPRQVTLSGDVEALEEIAASLKEKGLFHRFLATDYAFHGAQMDPIQDGLRQELVGIAGSEARLPMISTVTATAVGGSEMDAEYWWQNVRQPVRFAAAVERIISEDCAAFLEIGPHPVMASSLAEIALAKGSSAFIVASLRRAEDERATMLQGLATFYRHGAEVNWHALYRRPSRALRLPAYPWQRQRLWAEAPEADRDLRRPPPHPLLGARQPLPEPIWLNHLDARILPWLGDHRVAGAAVLPATAYLEMARAAVHEHLHEQTIFLEDVRFTRLLILPDEQSIRTCVRLDTSAGSFQILAAKPGTPETWEVHAEGLFRPGRLHRPVAEDLDRLRSSLPQERDPAEIYRELTKLGQVYGPAFQGLTSLRLSGNDVAFGAIAEKTPRDSGDYLLFPPSLDSCLHPTAALKRPQDMRAAVVVSLHQFRLFAPMPAKVWSLLRIVKRTDHSCLGDVSIYDEAGAVVASIDGLKLRTIEPAAGSRKQDRKFYRFEWEEAPAAEPDSSCDEVLIFGGHNGAGATLAESVHNEGISVAVAFDHDQDEQRNGRSLVVDSRQEGWANELWTMLAMRGDLPERVVYFSNCDRARDCTRLLELTRARLALSRNNDSARWLIVTRNAQPVQKSDSVDPFGAVLWGFARSLQTEQPLWNLSLVDLDHNSSVACIARELFGIEPEVAFRGGKRWVQRFRQFEPKVQSGSRPPPACTLDLTQADGLDSLQFRGCARSAPGSREIEVEIAAAGLNFRDLMKALGIYPLKNGERANLGDEFSGRVVRIGRAIRRLKPGDHVMGFAPAGGAFSSHLTVSAESVWKLPPNIDLVEAASVPVVFGTAFHALHTLARLRRGETVLIHAAAGGVGLAAVQLAQRIGAVILATAGNDPKREYLRSLGVAQVMDSRTLDFADETLRFTDGRGVDVVLNSLAGAFQQKSLAVCASHGRFVEIGKRDLFEGNALPLAAFQRSLSFSAFDLAAVLASKTAECKAVRRFLGHGFASGRLKPIPCAKLAADDAVSAFRFMQAAQHTGKIVLEFDAERRPEVPAEFWPASDGTYLITGGLSGFGLATAGWLAERGAMHLALVSRSGGASAQDAALLDDLRARGVSVQAMAVNVANAQELAAALSRLKRSAPPLRGIFHAAMLLHDSLIVDMKTADLQAVLAPKIAGAWNLHQQTRDLSLECFVMFSSISSIVGAPGQANYAAANAFLDALAHHRRAAGLPALSINWGQIADVGRVAERPELSSYFESIGVRAVSSREALALLPKLLASTEPQVGVIDVDWDKLGRASTKFGASPVFRELVQAAKGSERHEHGSWRETILSLPPDERLPAVTELVIGQLAATLGLPATEIDPSGRLSGMDSLMAVEMKVRIESQAGCELPMELFSAEITAERVAQRILQQLENSKTKGALEPLPEEVEAPGEVAAPLLRKETTPLVELIRRAQLQPLTAAALMSWPDALFQEARVSPAAFFQRMNGSRVSFDLILETPLGSIGIFMLPLTSAQIRPNESFLSPLLLDGVEQATASGARCVALTGLIPSVTEYGATVQSICAEKDRLAPVSTGHGTTIAAVVLNFAAILREAGRDLSNETVLFYGIGSIGSGALRLLLNVLPHPAELRLCDPYRGAGFFEELTESLRSEHGYEGAIHVVTSHNLSETDLEDVGTIVGATNVANVIDVAKLAPGTLIVDDSAPHCLRGPAALARFRETNDILCTEGGFVRSRKPMPRVAHVPPSIAPGLPAELPQLLFSMLNPHDITGCVLSALLSATRADLPPTVGLVEAEEARQHWNALNELGFTAAALNFEGTFLQPELIAEFRERFGKRSDASLPLVGAR